MHSLPISATAASGIRPCCQQLGFQTMSLFRISFTTFPSTNGGWYTEVLCSSSTLFRGKSFQGIKFVSRKKLIVTSAQNVVKVRHERGEKSRIALLGLIPFFVTWTLIPAYLYLQPVILNEHLVPFVFFAGLINSYSVGQMITAHLVKLPFPYYNVLILPLAYGVFDSLGPLLQEHIGIGWPSALGDDVYQVGYMFCMLGMAIGVYGSFVVCFTSIRAVFDACCSTLTFQIDVIVTICDYLDIWCLTIKHPYNEAEELKKQN
jgi:ethanolaminephosphotransferase